MGLITTLKQYYRYQRNWKKHRSRKKRGGYYKNADEQQTFYSQFLKPGDLVFDVGANIGDKAELFLSLGVKVVAVEPQESCWRVLKRRFKGQDVTVEACGLSFKKGQSEFYLDKSTTLSSMSPEWIKAVKESGRFLTHNWSSKVVITTRTLDDLICQYGMPMFCKIDVEGFEYGVLKGLSRPIPAISMEFVAERIEPTLQCIDYLTGLGNYHFNYYLGEAGQWADEKWLNPKEIKKVLISLDGTLSTGDFYACLVIPGNE